MPKPPSSEPLPGDQNMDDDKDAYSYAPVGPGMLSQYKKADEVFGTTPAVSSAGSLLQGNRRHPPRASRESLEMALNEESQMDIAYDDASSKDQGPTLKELEEGRQGSGGGFIRSGYRR